MDWYLDRIGSGTVPVSGVKINEWYKLRLEQTFEENKKYMIFKHDIMFVNGWDRRRDASVDGTGERTGCGLLVNGQYPWMDAMYA